MKIIQNIDYVGKNEIKLSLLLERQVFHRKLKC